MTLLSSRGDGSANAEGNVAGTPLPEEEPQKPAQDDKKSKTKSNNDEIIDIDDIDF
jgi:hypothetical protein